MNQLRRLCAGLIFSAWFFLSCLPATANPLDYSGNNLSISMADWRWLAAVEGQEVGSDSVLFEKGSWNTPSNGFDFGFSGRIWLRLDINFSADPGQLMFFYVPNGFADDVQGYVLREGVLLVSQAIGSDIPLADKGVANPFLVMPVPVEQPGHYSLLLNVQSTQATQLMVSPALITQHQLLMHELPDKYAWGAGVIGSMVTYIFFMGVLLIYRFQLKMLYAMLVALSISLAVLTREGLLFQATAWQDPWIFQQFVLSMVMFSIAMASMYLYEDLRGKLSQRWMHISLLVIALLTISLAAFNLFERLFPIPLLGLLAYAALLLAQLLMVFILLHRLLYADFRGKLMSLAWLTFLITTLMRFLLTLYPQLALSDSVWWNLASTSVMGWVLVDYIWTVAQQEFDQQRLRSASESRIDLVNRLSHELRTPLNAVIGLADLLKTNKDLETVHSYAVMIQSSGQNLLGLVNDILDFSRMENHTIELADTPFRLDELLVEVNAGFLRQALDAGVVPVIYIEPATPLYLRGDELRIKQILTNLISNAIKFCQKNGLIEIRVKAGAVKGDSVELLCQVRDNGRGVPIALQEKIFEPYQQAEARDATELKGTGLGLAITQLLVKQMGGRISLLSKPGEGACFSFNLFLFSDSAALDLQPLFLPLKQQRMLLCTAINAVSELLYDNLNYRQVRIQKSSSLDALWDDPYASDVLITDAITTMNETDFQRIQGLSPGLRVVIFIMEVPHWLEDIDTRRFRLVRIPKPLLDIFAEIAEFLGGDPVNLNVHTDLDESPEVGEHHILLVDDNLINLTVAEKLLQSLGVESVRCQSGVNALNQLSSDHHRFSLVLLDCEMPGLDGFETCRRLREFEATNGLAPLPVVALTAHALSEVRDACIEAGMNEVLYKPVNRDILAKLLARY